MAWTAAARTAAAAARRAKRKTKNMVSYSDTEYRSSWGRKPRGTGNWAFNIQASHKPKTIWVKGTYSSAKKVAESFGKRLVRAKHNIVKVSVGS